MAEAASKLIAEHEVAERPPADAGGKEAQQPVNMSRGQAMKIAQADAMVNWEYIARTKQAFEGEERDRK